MIYLCISPLRELVVVVTFILIVQFIDVYKALIGGIVI